MSHIPGGHSRRVIAEINMVPFIDVILVVLVIFMITTPLLNQGVKVALPQTEARAVSPEKKEPLIVTVDSNGNYYLNIAEKPNQPITPEALSNLVRTQLVGGSTPEEQRPILVRGDKDVNYGRIMQAMVLLQQAGAKTVNLITQPSDSTPQPNDKAAPKDV